MSEWLLKGEKVANSADQAMQGDFRLRTFVTGPEIAEGEEICVIDRQRLIDGMAELGYIIGRNPDGEDETIDATLLIVKNLREARQAECGAWGVAKALPAVAEGERDALRVALKELEAAALAAINDPHSERKLYASAVADHARAALAASEETK